MPLDEIHKLGALTCKVIALPYTWRQELGDVALVIPVPKGTRSKQLDVSIQKKRLRVGLKVQEPILSGELCKEIKVDDSTWTLGTISQYALWRDI